MNYEDEDYVRLYTRDTPTWLSLGWEGQALLALTMRKVGRRNGVLDFEGFEPLEALQSVTGLPPEVVAIGFERLSKRGVMAVDGQRIVLPKFVKAQWARQGSAARKRASRDAQAADTVITELIVAQNHSTVTRGHTESQLSQEVTPSHTRSLSNPTNPIQDQNPPSPPAGGKRARRKPQREIPEDWRPVDRHRQKASELGADLDLEAQKFRNHALANDRRCSDWDRAFDNWLLNSRPASGARPPAAPVDLARRQAEKAAAEAELARRTRAELDELGTGERPIAESQQVLAAVIAGTHGRRGGST